MKVSMISQSSYGIDRESDDEDLMDTEEDVHSSRRPEGGQGHFTSKAEIRKSNKPIMEKKRRARINNCLTELKGILLEAMKKDPARHSKLEKADILELTVRHLQNVQRNQLAHDMTTDPTVLHLFKNGFSECATEVGRYLTKLEGVEEGVRHRLSGHLSTCVNGLQQVSPPPFRAQQAYSPFGVVGANSMRFTPMTVQPQALQPQFAQIPPQMNSTPIQVQSPKVLIHRQMNAQYPPPQMSKIPGDLNNNSGYGAQNISQVLQTPQNGSAFTPINSRRPPTPPPSPLTTSPNSTTSSRSSLSTSALSSSESLNISLERSPIASDSNNDKGTNTLGLLSSTPIDFSLNRNRPGETKSERTRVVKVEPMIMISTGQCSTKEVNPWRPW